MTNETTRERLERHFDVIQNILRRRAESDDDGIFVGVERRIIDEHLRELSREAELPAPVIVWRGRKGGADD